VIFIEKVEEFEAAADKLESYLLIENRTDEQKRQESEITVWMDIFVAAQPTDTRDNALMNFQDALPELPNGKRLTRNLLEQTRASMLCCLRDLKSIRGTNKMAFSINK